MGCQIQRCIQLGCSVTGQVANRKHDIIIWLIANFFIQCECLWHVLDHCLVQVYLKYPASKERYRRSSCGGCSKSAGNELPKFPVHFLNSLNYRKFNYFSSVKDNKILPLHTCDSHLLLYQAQGFRKFYNSGHHNFPKTSFSV